MRFYISQKVVYSHLDPIGGKRLAAREITRLTAWLNLQFENKRRVIDLTLTYDPEPYGGVNDEHAGKRIYDRMRSSRHLPRFFERLADATSVDYRGRWRAKLEFNRNGHPHWHVVIEGLPFIDKDDIASIWGHGHVWIRKANRKTVSYLAKYNAKDSSYPDWLYDQPRRSVKIWSTSPGFWDEVNSLRVEMDEAKQTSFDQFWADARRELSERRQAFVQQMGIKPPDWESLSLRDQIQHAARTTIIKDENGQTVEVTGIDVSSICVVLSQMKAEFEGQKYGWMRWDSHWNEIEWALKIAKRAVQEISEEPEVLASLDYWSKQQPEPPSCRKAAEPPSAGGLTLFKYQDRAQVVHPRTGLPLHSDPKPHSESIEFEDGLFYSEENPQFGEVVYHDEIPF